VDEGVYSGNVFEGSYMLILSSTLTSSSPH
jgi:hypothetical protein